MFKHQHASISGMGIIRNVVCYPLFHCRVSQICTIKKARQLGHPGITIPFRTQRKRSDHRRGIPSHENGSVGEVGIGTLKEKG